MSQHGTPLRLDRRRVLAGAVAAAMAGLAGCGDDAPGQSDDAKDPLAYVSASASVVVDVDNAVADDDATRQLVETYESDDGENYFQTFEDRTGFPPEEADRTLLFADESNADEQGTLVVEAPWDEDEAVEALQEVRGAEYEEADHDAGTIHEPQSDDEIALGVAAEGQFVYDTRADVETCLDVYDGSGDGLGDPLRSAFEDAREAELASTEGASQGFDGAGTPTDGGTDTGDGNGTETDGGGDDEGGDTEFTKYVAAATDDPRAYLPEDDDDRVPPTVSLSMYDSLETATATYFAGEGEVAVDVVLRADDEEVAREVADFTATALTYLRTADIDGAVKDELAQMGVRRDGTDVLVVYRSDAEGAASLVTWL